MCNGGSKIRFSCAILCNYFNKFYYVPSGYAGRLVAAYHAYVRSIPLLSQLLSSLSCLFHFRSSFPFISPQLSVTTSPTLSLQSPFSSPSILTTLSLPTLLLRPCDYTMPCDMFLAFARNANSTKPQAEKQPYSEYKHSLTFHVRRYTHLQRVRL